MSKKLLDGVVDDVAFVCVFVMFRGLLDRNFFGDYYF